MHGWLVHFLAWYVLSDATPRSTTNRVNRGLKLATTGGESTMYMNMYMYMCVYVSCMMRVSQLL